MRKCIESDDFEAELRFMTRIGFTAPQEVVFTFAAYINRSIVFKRCFLRELYDELSPVENRDAWFKKFAYHVNVNIGDLSKTAKKYGFDLEGEYSGVKKFADKITLFYRMHGNRIIR